MRFLGSLLVWSDQPKHQPTTWYQQLVPAGETTQTDKNVCSDKICKNMKSTPASQVRLYTLFVYIQRGNRLC